MNQWIILLTLEPGMGKGEGKRLGVKRVEKVPRGRRPTGKREPATRKQKELPVCPLGSGGLSGEGGGRRGVKQPKCKNNRNACWGPRRSIDWTAADRPQWVKSGGRDELSSARRQKTMTSVRMHGKRTSKKRSRGRRKLRGKKSSIRGRIRLK